jgi:DICT domain-containing protein
VSRYGDTDSSVDGELSIGEMSRRTGLSVAGLRNWEVRYGFPVPVRTPSGQRRYREADAEMVVDVLRLRHGGLSVGAAIEAVRAAAAPVRASSLFAGVRRREPSLGVHKMDKKTLLALTWAIEDECCATAQTPLLLGAFQERRYYRPARSRWANLASTAEQTVVFADFSESRALPGPMAEIAIPDDSPLRREWALICEAGDRPACVLGWEPPGQQDKEDSERVFEAIWSVEPRVVRHAARLGMDLVAQSLPDFARDAEHRLSGAVLPASPDLLRASGVMERTLDYVCQTRSGVDR